MFSAPLLIETIRPVLFRQTIAPSLFTICIDIKFTELTLQALEHLAAYPQTLLLL